MRALLLAVALLMPSSAAAPGWVLLATVDVAAIGKRCMSRVQVSAPYPTRAACERAGRQMRVSSLDDLTVDWSCLPEVP